MLAVISIAMVVFMVYLQNNYPPHDPAATGPPVPVDWSPYGGLAVACIVGVVLIDIVTIALVMARAKKQTKEEKRPFGPTEHSAEADALTPSNRIEKAVAKRAVPKGGSR